MTDMRRTLLWVVFSMSLVLLWDAWNKHNGQPSMFAPPVAAPASAASAPPGGAASSTAAVPSPSAVGTPAAGAAATAAATPPAAAGQSAPVAPPVEITTDVVKATFDSRGGTLVRLELLKQTDLQDRQKNVVLLEQSPQRLYLAQTGLIPASGGGPLPNHLTPMEPRPGPRSLEAVTDGSNQLQVVFESAPVQGVQLLKTYTFRRGEYVADVRHEVVNTSGAPVSPQLYLQLVRDGNAPAGESSLYFTFTGPAVYTEEAKFNKVPFKDIEKRRPGDAPGHPTQADNGWVAMVQHYYASAWLLGDEAEAANRIPREFYTRKVDVNQYAVGMIAPLGTLAPGERKTVDARLFAGPQEENRLAAIAPGLELVKDYGWFTILAKPLFWLLTKLHGLLGNWGWAIVALVVLLKIAFYGLNASAYRSMAKMKAVNPRVMELRERYKDKPQQLQQEMMRIYREEKVNPVGGCLPIVLQMPFFIALYWVLLSSVEMRNASWLYIADLARPDALFGIVPWINLPLGPLPLLMLGTSLLQVWLNPTPPDPVQAKMMWIMPLLFSVMFFFFPAGLVLYWLTNNILSIAQQYLINKRLGVLNK